MNYCPSCGHSVAEDAKFCSQCGISLTAEEITNQKESVAAGENIEVDTKPRCPACGSENLIVSKKGYSLGKGVLGMVVLGWAGAFAGLIGSNKHICKCIHCGKEWEL